MKDLFYEKSKRAHVIEEGEENVSYGSSESVVFIEESQARHLGGEDVLLFCLCNLMRELIVEFL